MNLAVASGLLLALAGCTAFYLASPQQRWRAAPLPARPARLAAGVLLIAGMAALCQALQPLTATYVLLIWVMLLLVLLPYVGALLVLRRGA
jgi:hypothetical protein